MESLRGWPAAGVLLVLGLLFLVMAALYATGNLQLAASGSGHHYKHAIACVVLAVACVVGANFLRPRAETTY